MASVNSTEMDAVKAVIELEHRFQAIEVLLEAFEQLAGDEQPAWFMVIRAEVLRLEAALVDVSRSVRSQAKQ